MPVLSLDIVLLVDRVLNDSAIRYNQTLRENQDGVIRLARAPDVQFGVPHLSLAMLGVSSECVELLLKEVKRETESFGAFEILTKPVQARRNQAGSLTHGLDIEPNDRLISLHEKMVAVAEKFPNQAIGSDSFVKECDEPRKKDRDWVESFLVKHARENFQPHITLGFGSLEILSINFPKSSRITSLAVFQLGAGCTCRKQLATFALSSAAM